VSVNFYGVRRSCRRFYSASTAMARAAATKFPMKRVMVWERSQDAPLRRKVLPRNFKSKLDVEKRLVEVGNDVFNVFDTDGKANQTLRDAYALADFDGHRGVSHQCGERN
jgi:hypothetical protein